MSRSPLPWIVVCLFSLTACTTSTSTEGPGQSPELKVTAELLAADFEVNFMYEEPRTTVCVVDETQFLNTSTGDPERWQWTFPDGETSDEWEPVISDEIRGDVTLTIYRGDEESSVTHSAENLVVC